MWPFLFSNVSILRTTHMQRNYCSLENTINRHRLGNIFHFIQFQFRYFSIYSLKCVYISRSVEWISMWRREPAHCTSIWMEMNCLTVFVCIRCRLYGDRWRKLPSGNQNEMKSEWTNTMRKTKIMEWKSLCEVWWRWSWKKSPKCVSRLSRTHTNRHRPPNGECICKSRFLMEIPWKFVSDENNNNVYSHLKCTQWELFYF